MKKHIYFSSHQQSIQGTTLIEVIVSVFLLTFGVLGLMAAQIRSVASVSEAESRSIIAQAAENLADAMQMNPQVIEEKGSILRRYNDGYTSKSIKTITPNPDATAPTALWTGSKTTGITKQNLAANHLAIFEYNLNQVPNASSISYQICLDKADSQDPVFSAAGIMDAQCAPANSPNDKTVIKIGWLVRADNESSKPVAYTYQLPVPQ